MSAYEEGYSAYRLWMDNPWEGEPRNPYDDDTIAGDSWYEGWCDAMDNEW